MAKNRNTIKPNRIKSGIVAKIADPVAPRETDKDKDFVGDWVQYFKDDNNIFPNDLAKRAKRSSVHNAILESKLVFTCGDGLSFERNGEAIDLDTDTRLRDYVTSINNKGESLEDIYKRCAKDLITIGSFSVQAVKESGFTFYFHQDTTEVRLEKENELNIIENAYISPDWYSIKNEDKEGVEEVIEKIPMFTKGTREANSIIYRREYSPEHRYYGLPDYIGALHWIDISYKIPTFNLTRFKNGFMPSAVVDLVGEPPEGMTPEDYITNVVIPKFTDEGNNSKILFQMVDSQDNKTNVQLFDGIKDGDFTELQQLADQNIISSHRWHPSLSGIQTAGKLGSSQEIRNAFELVNNTVIRGYKNMLIPVFNMMLEEAGFGDVTIKVHTKSPITYANEISVEQALSKNEKRDLLGFEAQEEDVKEVRQALNGAQVTSMVEVVTNYNLGNVDRDSAIEILKIAFSVTDEEAQIIIPNQRLNTIENE